MKLFVSGGGNYLLSLPENKRLQASDAKRKMEKILYTAPEIEVLSVLVERGFADSLLNDYTAPAPTYDVIPDEEQEDY